MGESIHELHFFQHVCTVTAQSVHLKSHHLARSSVAHLEHFREEARPYFFTGEVI